MIDKWEIVIGCEIHTQLLTKTKAFCACENRYGGMPNTRVCPVCLGLPGALPRISKGYVELGAVAGQALNCHIARFTKFDRKHYFYPDLTKGYQITQYDIPLCLKKTQVSHSTCLVHIHTSITIVLELPLQKLLLNRI